MKLIASFLCCLSLCLPLFAQKRNAPARTIKPEYNKLYQYGEADSFLAGLYEDSTFSVSQIARHGDFGLGAPNMLDGELIVYQGKAYQTKANGKTTLLSQQAKASLLLVTFFKADTSFYITSANNKKEAFEQIDRYLNKRNAAYVIKISGSFGLVKTRAFPPVEKKPYLPLAQMLDKQHFFTFSNTGGVLAGYKLPPYLNGVSIADYHFHFLSDDKTMGGHMTEFAGKSLKVKIAELHTFEMRLPQTEAYRQFDFKKVHVGDTQKAEQQ
jgi:acetolactate decarboxylase